MVDPFLDRLVAACREIGLPFEIVVADDGSRDGTLARLLARSADLPEMIVLELSRNFGQMSALSAGLEWARGDAVVVMDGDLQDPPELIGRFVEEWRKGADVVYGLRTERGEGWLARSLTSAFYALLARISSIDIPRDAGTFGLMDRRAADRLARLPERERFLAGLRAWTGGRQIAVPYARPDRTSGRSRVGFFGRSDLAAAALTSFSRLPLRAVSFLSLAVGVILFSVGLTTILVRFFTNLAIPEWATFTTLVGMTGFVQSLVLAVLSEYVSVIFEEVKRRPAFLIRNVYTDGKSAEGVKR